MTVSPKVPQTKLGAALRKLSEELLTKGDDIHAYQCQTAAALLDKTCLVMGAKGERVKTLGAYYHAVKLYQFVTGTAYDG